MTDKVTLIDTKGTTSIYISAEINEKGDLLISGQDIGQAPQEMFGDSDYEYWLKVRASNKNLVLLAFLENLYAGNPSLISELMHFLESKNIPYEFFPY
jgi:hypothetical protein